MRPPEPDFELRILGNELWELEGHRDAARAEGRADLTARCDRRLLAIAEQAYRAAQTEGPDRELASYVAGLALRMLGRWEEAEGGFRRVVACNPNNGEAWLELTAIYAELDRPLDALKAAQTGATLLPDVAEAWLNLAQSLLTVDEVATALEALATAESLEPHHPRLAELRALLSE